MVIKVRMTQTDILDKLGDSFLPVSRGLVVNVEFIRQLGPKSCILKDGREILLSRSNTEEIHSAYAEYVFSQLSERDGAPPDGTKRS
jgi:DNA-binding LytR/AlgR family response regulator